VIALPIGIAARLIKRRTSTSVDEIPVRI